MGLFGKSKQKDKNIEQMKSLLDKLEYADLDKLCKDVIGKYPQSDSERLERIQILEFIWDYYRKGILSVQQVKDFAVKQGSISADFFD
jgi:hypothetical protein